MFIDQRGDGFDFENDFIVTYEIRREGLNEGSTAILQGLRRFGEKRNSLQIEFNLQTLVIDRFEKATAFLLIDGKTRTDNGIAFFFPDQTVLSLLFVSFRVFRGLKF